MQWRRDGAASLLQVGGNLALDLGGGGVGEWQIEEGREQECSGLASNYICC